MAWWGSRDRVAGVLRRPEVWIALAALAAAAYSQAATFTNPYVVSNDARLHTFWMEVWRDPALFPRDRVAAFAGAYQPWAYLLLYRLAAFVVAPLTLSRVLPLLLLPWAALATYRLGEKLAGRYAGLLAAAWVTLAPVVIHKMSGGHARGFAVPLLATCAYYFVRQAPRRLALALVVTSGFYPMAFVLAILAFLACAFRFPRGRPRLAVPRAVLVGIAAGAAIGGALVVARASLVPQSMGSVATRADIVGRPEFGPEGIYPVYPTPPVWVVLAQEVRRSAAILPPAYTRTPPREANPAVAQPLEIALLVLVLALLAATPWLRLPPLIPALFASGVVMFWVSDLVLMQLYLPVRYVQYSVRLAVPLLAGALLAKAVERLPWRRVRTGAQAALLALPLMNLPVLRGKGLDDYSSQAPLFDFLEQTPVDALIAAHPTVADAIPLFAHRKVFVDFEHALPFYPQYWEETSRRTSAFFRAYYARDLASVCRFLDANAITHLVIDRRHFSRRHLKRPHLYFEPFGSEIRALTRRREDLVLAGLPDDRAVFVHGILRVVTPESLGCGAP